ncbi:hypothetical protein A4A49_57750, partial [Nicotiana attenuata]
TEEQYKQLVNLLQKTKTNDCSTNTTGIIALIANVATNDHVWIVDSGATHHVTHCKNALSNLKRVDNRTNGVQLPTGNKADITHIGDAVVLGDKTIEGVLYVPDFKFNLLLVSKLTKQLCCSVGFYPNFCIFQRLYNGKGDKFTVRARKDVLIGYSETQKGYRLYDLENRSIFVSKDVVFKEEIFPFSNTTCPDDVEDLFTSQNSSEAEEMQQSHPTMIPSTSQNIQPQIEDTTATAGETINDARVLDNPTEAQQHSSEPIESKQVVEATEAQEHSLEPTEEASVPPQQASADVETRKSDRQGKPSIWLKDYIT